MSQSGLVKFTTSATDSLVKLVESLLPQSLRSDVTVLGSQVRPSKWLLATMAVAGAGTLLYKLPIRYPVALLKQKRNLGYLCHPSEIGAIAGFLMFGTLPSIPQNISDNTVWCYKKLKQTSRSFSAVILELHEELREPIAIFYLVLRGLDTVEDDMKPSVEDKVKQLQAFHERLSVRGWNLKGFGDKPEEIDLLEQFDKVIDVFLTLKPKYQAVIANITKRMGDGMAEFLSKKAVTVQDYELYCHYVAGLVGHGLSKLFGESGLEDESYKLPEMEPISNSMGLFLQKTNIIRDYLEDISEQPPRIFWPREIWSNYATKIEDLKEWENRKDAVLCLNHMISDAMKHGIDCLNYMQKLKDPSVFKFCAIPQVMAIATLDLCYDNHDVFRYEVKIRKGTAVQLILGSTNYTSICKYFLSYAKKILRRVNDATNKHAEDIRGHLNVIIARCEKDLAQAK